MKTFKPRLVRSLLAPALAAISIGGQLLGCGVPEDSVSPTSAPVAALAQSSTGIVPVLDWTMPPLIDLNPLAPVAPANASALRFPVVLDACASQGNQVGRLSQYEWTSTDFRLEAILPIRSSSCKTAELMLKEGTYAVTLRIVSDNGTVASVTSNVVVKNILVVSMGDSVASGEGSPDVPAAGSTPAKWRDRRCHRSLHSGHALAAQALENADRRSSVTFVSTACSGASSSVGLLGPYEGQDEADRSLPKLSSQIEQVQKLICPNGCPQGTPAIDTLLLSIGANDVGFGDVVHDCAIPGGIVTRCGDVEQTVTVTAKILGLKTVYSNVNSAIRGQLNPRSILITDYQDPTWADRAADGSAKLCNELVFKDAVGRVDGNIDSAEIKWARTNVILPLNAAVASAASAHGWTLVKVTNDFVGHGYCANSNWIVRYDQSFRGQGNESGTMHPNRLGQEAYGKRLAAAAIGVLGQTSEAGSTAELGFPFAHSSSGLCIHPNGGSANPENGTNAVLFTECANEQRLQYRMLPNGNIQHVSSGKCLHPWGGASNPDNGTNVVFWEGCDEDRTAFEVTDQGSLRHKWSGKCIHPEVGGSNPPSLTKLVLWDGCDEDRLRFEGRFPEGRLVHSANQCIHPEGGSNNPETFTRLVLWNDCRNDPSRIYRFRPDGNIEHISSGKCLHPRGGSATPENGTDLILFEKCGESRLAFRVTPAGSIQHISSGKCVHPNGGAVSPAVGTNLLLWDGCNMDRIKFAPVTQL